MAQSKDIIDIEEEYARNIELNRSDIRTLQKWILDHPKYPATSELVLFLCLHSSYYDVEKAKTVVDRYNTLREKWPELFKNRDPSTEPLRPNLPIMLQWTLKQPTHENYRVFYIKTMDYDTSKFNLYEQIKLFMVVSDFWLNMIGNIEGFAIILDIKGFTWGHIAKLGINPIRKLIAYVQEAFPIRLKSVHFVNASAMVDKILLLASPFMNKELRSIIHVHTEFETLYKFVPKYCLPKDYDGDDVTLKELHETMMSTLLENANMFSE